MAADHPSLKSLWLDIMRLVSKQRQDTLVNNFMRNTKKSEKQEYEENMLIKGAVIHFPRNCLLAGQEITVFGCRFLLMAKRDPNGCLTAHNVVKYPSMKYSIS